MNIHGAKRNVKYIYVFRYRIGRPLVHATTIRSIHFHEYNISVSHRRSQGPATLGSWPGSHGAAEAGGEREVRTQGRRPVRGGWRRGRQATGERREGEPPTPSLGLPLRLWTPPRGVAPISGTEPKREWESPYNFFFLFSFSFLFLATSFFSF